jgi:hypothetical protein
MLGKPFTLLEVIVKELFSDTKIIPALKPIIKSL